MTFVEKLNNLQSSINWLEKFIVENVVRLSPWLAPIPTAYLVGKATFENLDWAGWVSVAAALSIELLGVATTKTAIELYEYNKSKRKSDPVASLNLSIATVVTYFVAVVVLTVLLEIMPELRVFTAIVFPFVSLTGMSVIGLRIGHRERLLLVEKSKIKKPPKSNGKSTNNRKTTGTVKKRYNDFLTALETGELTMSMSGEEIGSWAGKSPETGRLWKRKYKKEKDDF